MMRTCDSSDVDAGDALAFLEHIVRLYRNSECRTPLICSLTDGDPIPTIKYLAAQQQLSMWTIALDSPKAEQNALDYLDVGFKNGDWVCLRVSDETSQTILRQVALQLMTVSPDPRGYPKRELFRLWILLEYPLDLNEHIHTPLPTILRKNALFGTQKECESEDMCRSHRTHLTRLTAVEPTLYEKEQRRKEERLVQGHGDDSDSEMEEPEKKITGLWFHRHAELCDEGMHGCDQEATRSGGKLFAAIQSGCLEATKAELLQAQDGTEKDGHRATAPELLNNLWKHGLNPLMWSLMYGHLPIARYLLEQGADPNLPAKSSGSPLLFMGLETVEELRLLLDHGLDLDQRFEGKRFVDHPGSSPILIRYLVSENLV